MKLIDFGRLFYDEDYVRIVYAFHLPERWNEKGKKHLLFSILSLFINITHNKPLQCPNYRRLLGIIILFLRYYIGNYLH